MTDTTPICRFRCIDGGKTSTFGGWEKLSSGKNHGLIQMHVPASAPVDLDNSCQLPGMTLYVAWDGMPELQDLTLALGLRLGPFIKESLEHLGSQPAELNCSVTIWASPPTTPGSET